jgi:DNA invertase Pin-like site-specific DNA recombinase
MAEDERQRIVKRANDGRTAARAKRVKLGRRPKLTDHQREEARRRLEAGESDEPSPNHPECTMRRCWGITRCAQLGAVN